MNEGGCSLISDVSGAQLERLKSKAYVLEQLLSYKGNFVVVSDKPCKAFN